jgi:hypothetical protein
MRKLGHRPRPESELCSGRHPGTGRGCRPVVEATDVGDAIAPQGEDLPALGYAARLASGGRAGDLKPDEKCPGADGYLSDHRSCTGGSRAGPPRDDLIAVLAVGIAGTLRRTPAGTGVEQIPDGAKVAGLQGEPDSSGKRGRLFRGAGIVWHEDLPALHSWSFQRRRAGHPTCDHRSACAGADCGEARLTLTTSGVRVPRDPGEYRAPTAEACDVRLAQNMDFTEYDADELYIR